jgi:DNA-binding NtrC family response regulator
MLSIDGTSDLYAAFVRQVERIARSDATVLLCGESGTGKEVAARRLHEMGSRREGPFVAVNIAAIAPTLVESALFGHEKGAFTDARQERPGLFRRAEGGTILLDDIDLLSPQVQVKLLRVLQEREVEPLGASGPVPIDVRVVATTNRDLAAEAEQGRFRQDLYWRLAVVVLEVPPLRSRLEDVGALGAHLVERIAERLGIPPRPLSDEARERLQAHPWPGNIRELENALERAMVMGRNSTEPLTAGEFEFLEEACSGVEEDLAARALAHGLSVEVMTRAMMQRALEEQRGNVSAAARQVGLTRRAFDYRLGRGEPEEPDASPGESAEGDQDR